MSNLVCHGSCLDILPTLPSNSVDSVVTDPPYELGFMGKHWDSSGIAYTITVWQECLRVLKPGGHLLAFGGTRTHHRMTCAIEDAGFEIRDELDWIYGSGFPKSHNIAIAIDKQAGVLEHRGTRNIVAGVIPGVAAVRAVAMAPPDPITDDAKQWVGWGTALKPAREPIVLARKPLEGTIAANVKTYGTGALNIAGCRIGERWPANVVFDEDAAAELDGQQDGVSRFFYVAKPSAKEKNAGLGDDFLMKRPDDRTSTGMGTFEEKGVAVQKNHHPTVKPITLLRYLCRLVTPPNGIVLDPFCGSGSTGCAAACEGFRFVGIEQNHEYVNIATARIAHWQGFAHV